MRGWQFGAVPRVRAKGDAKADQHGVTLTVHDRGGGALGVSVNVHLDGAGLDRVADVLARRSRAAVEDESGGLRGLAAVLLLDVLLAVV